MSAWAAVSLFGVVMSLVIIIQGFGRYASGWEIPVGALCLTVNVYMLVGALS